MDAMEELTSCGAAPKAKVATLADILKQADAGFTETLLNLIDKTGKKDSEIYKKANVDRKLFSKIRSDRDYRPSKQTVLAFAIALQMPLDEVRDMLLSFARKLSSEVDYADSERRRTIHLAGVFVCNFVNRMYGIGAEVVGEEVGFDLLKPLIEETALKALATENPASVQTGPAVRGDREVWERHKALLTAEGKGSAATIYEQISNDIWQTSKKN